MKTRRLCELELAWDASALPFDPFEPVMPLRLPDGGGRGPAQVRVELRARPIESKAPDPTTRGAVPALFHGATDCYVDGEELVLWDGASALCVSRDGTQIDAAVHPSSLERAFHFGSVTVLMASWLALRHHGYFHLHAAGFAPGDGSTWLLPGESGSGKSTLALAFLDAGADWLSDDALLLRRQPDGGVGVVGWPRKLRLTDESARAFAARAPSFVACPPESARQWELDPRAGFAGAALGAASGPFTLLFPARSGTADSQLVPLGAAEALGRALHACTWVAAEGMPRRQEQLALLSALCSEAPAYELRAGSRVLSEPARAVAEIRQLVAAARARLSRG